MMPSTYPFLRAKRGFVLFALALAFSASAPAQIDQDFGQMLRWRNIGPHRGGRTRAIGGVPSQPNVFYMAQVNGGVFKTTDFGRTWQPIFDDQPTGSIGALAVSVSDPDIIYVGSGEGLHRPDLSVGDGIYKSIDAGKTWTHLGLRDGQQIAQIAIDPQNPDRLFVAVAGHPYGPNEERGIFRSLDGGQTFREGPLQRREHRRRGRADRSEQSGDRLRFALGSARRPVGEQRLEWDQRRHLQIDRWRENVEAASRRDFPTVSCRRTSRSRRVRRKTLFAAVATEGRLGALSLG